MRRVETALALGLLVLVLSARLPAQEAQPRVVHVFVALADNQHQGIVPVPAKLGNGEDAERNLYWGSAYGVKTFFGRSADWERTNCGKGPKTSILERCVFKNRAANVYLVADAYRGAEIRQAIVDFFDAAGGANPETITLPSSANVQSFRAGGNSNLLAYIGHDGLMDFQLLQFSKKKNEVHRDAIILACASKQFFVEPLRASGAHPLLWTTGLMAPEAYTLKAALDGWIAGETGEQIRDRAAGAYDKYQKCGLRAAHHLFASGW